MKSLIITLTIFCWSERLVADQAGAFDPKHYLEERYYQSADKRIYKYAGIEVEVSDENFDGKHFLKMKTTSGAVYVEKPSPSFLDEDGNNILVDCQGTAEPAILEKSLLLKLQYYATEEVTLDAGFVSYLIINQCNGTVVGYKVDPTPGEIGVNIKNKSGDSYRIYNQGLKPNLGFKLDF